MLLKIMSAVQLPSLIFYRRKHSCTKFRTFSASISCIWKRSASLKKLLLQASWRLSWLNVV